jgi:hypothetical protein
MKPKISLQARIEYVAVATALAEVGVAQGSMFGMPCLKVERKVLEYIYP